MVQIGEDKRSFIPAHKMDTETGLKECREGQVNKKRYLCTDISFKVEPAAISCLMLNLTIKNIRHSLFKTGYRLGVFQG